MGFFSNDNEKKKDYNYLKRYHKGACSLWNVQAQKHFYNFFFLL